MGGLASEQRRVEAERVAHEDRDVLGKSYRLKEKFPHIRTYPSRREIDAYVAEFVKNLMGKIVLDYGCGRGEASLEYLEAGATVYGIDIAESYIRAAREAAATAGFPASRWRFETMDAHRLLYDANTFDAVIGNGILHHLEAGVAIAEIYRVLKPGGRVILLEPLADNPLLKLFRSLTPWARTEQERPFRARDVQRLTKQRRWQSEMMYCGVIEAPVAILTSVFAKGGKGQFLLRAAHRVETILHRRRWLVGWNQYVLFNLIKKK